ncbi:response regulator [Shewanella olleyana]|uniref:response regulator n=1 Tax=Shewanella olleyana TaxID=135626 RepID=UPI00200CCD8D|nr:response regulator [Shewanella olleyana]MCL1066892.1 response regulator [Shewanella olleyana]
MSNVSITICTTLHTILQDESFNNFKVVQLRDKFLAASANNLSIREAYKFIYRQISRLVKSGALIRIESKKSNIAIYQKTDRFHQLDFVKKEVNTRTQSKGKQVLKVENDAINQLKERLKQTEVDLFTSIGESEEYMSLYLSFPEMKGHLESQYMLAREKSSKLLGQIKAINSVLAHQQK